MALTMVPLHHAVAAADLRRCPVIAAALLLALVAGVAQVRFAKHQLDRECRVIAAAIAQQLEVPSCRPPYRHRGRLPTSLSSLMTSFLYTPPNGSLITISSVPSPPDEIRRQLNKSMPVTFSLVEVTRSSV